MHNIIIQLSILFIMFLFVGCKSDFNKGEEAFNNKDYGNALLIFQTIPKDNSNYNDAIKKIEFIHNYYDSKTIEESKNLFKQNNFLGALASLDKILNKE